MFCLFIFQGTMAVELLEQVPDLDAILVSASGGGMISGISIAAKSKYFPSHLALQIDKSNCVPFR
jgi:threonine dehydratase